MSNGYQTAGDVFDPDGYSSFFDNQNVNVLELEQSNETSVAIKISLADLVEVEWLDVTVHANYISPGNSPGTVGIDGNSVGFALAAKGVIRDSINWEDSDGDGLPNAVDVCPNQHAQSFDLDMDGCPDDQDNDGVIDEYDNCPIISSEGFDDDLDGCVDDGDGDGVGDNIDMCVTEIIDVR